MSCSATIMQGSIYFESNGKKYPLWARADAYDYPEHVSIIRRWLGRK
jgi:hypothetical protein